MAEHGSAGEPLNRRQFGRLALSAAAGAIGLPALPACTTAGTAGVAERVPAPLRYRGADISFTLQEEAIGTQLVAAGGVAPVERILAAAGATAVRLRVWVDPPDGYSDLRSLLVLARRAKAAGLAVVADLHYSDFWADHARQSIPAAWAGQGLDRLAATVRSYTRDVLVALADQGTSATAVQLGNEVGNGMLWPLGRVRSDDGREDWTGFAGLLRAAVQGVADAAGAGGRPETILHIEQVDDYDRASHTFDQLLARGVDVDVLAVSYYPFWHGSLADLSTTLGRLADRFDKDLLIAETSYPWTLTGGDEPELLVNSAGQLPDGDRFGADPAGQARFFGALREVVLDVPRGRGAGILAWEPGWLPGVPAAPPDVGNPYANLTMFDYDGLALPALATAFVPPSA